MISDSQSMYQYGPWWYLVFPSIALLLTTLAFNIFGDGAGRLRPARRPLYV